MRSLRIATLVALLAVLGANADIFNATHHYNWALAPDAITVDVAVTLEGPLYRWTYTVTNTAFDPSPGNGFSGFELDLPAAVPDLGGVTSPSPLWEVDCCSGAPVEWDIRDTTGFGIPLLGTGVFSFTSLPRTITTSTGWFHTWNGGAQLDVTFYSDTPGETGPEVPNVLEAPIPEPQTWLLVGPVAAWFFFRRLRSR